MPHARRIATPSPSSRRVSPSCGFPLDPKLRLSLRLHATYTSEQGHACTFTPRPCSSSDIHIHIVRQHERCRHHCGFPFPDAGLAGASPFACRLSRCSLGHRVFEELPFEGSSSIPISMTQEPFHIFHDSAISGPVRRRLLIPAILDALLRHHLPDCMSFASISREKGPSLCLKQRSLLVLTVGLQSSVLLRNHDRLYRTSVSLLHLPEGPHPACVQSSYRRIY